MMNNIVYSMGAETRMQSVAMFNLNWAHAYPVTQY